MRGTGPIGLDLATNHVERGQFVSTADKASNKKQDV
jgi:hypothetical protein